MAKLAGLQVCLEDLSITTFTSYKRVLFTPFNSKVLIVLVIGCPSTRYRCLMSELLLAVGYPGS